LTEFYKKKGSYDGLTSRCKNCVKQTAKKLNFTRQDGSKACARCHIAKDRSEFGTCKRLPDGCNIYCKTCKKGIEAIINAKLDNFVAILYNEMRSNHKERNLELSITREDILKLYEKQDGKCAMTGIQMTHVCRMETQIREGRYFYNVSVDRIDSKRGYILDNIQLVCSIINVMKWEHDNDEFIAICEEIAENNPLPEGINSPNELLPARKETTEDINSSDELLPVQPEPKIFVAPKLVIIDQEAKIPTAPKLVIVEQT
jgi:hypothetical protein